MVKKYDIDVICIEQWKSETMNSRQSWIIFAEKEL